MNPYIKPPKAKTLQSYCRLPWEEMTEEEAREAAVDCRVTEDEAAELERIFAEIEKKRADQL